MTQWLFLTNCELSYIMIEKDHLGDWSPEKDCCWRLTFRQHVRKSSIFWLWRWFPHRLSKRQSLTTVLLRTPITQVIFFNQRMLLLGSKHFLISYFLYQQSTLSRVSLKRFWPCELAACKDPLIICILVPFPDNRSSLLLPGKVEISFPPLLWVF